MALRTGSATGRHRVGFHRHVVVAANETTVDIGSDPTTLAFLDNPAKWNARRVDIVRIRDPKAGRIAYEIRGRLSVSRIEVMRDGE